MDMIFSVRQIQEKCKEQGLALYQVFVDLKKAFDTVNRTALWIILGKHGCPPGFVNMIRQLHENMKARLQLNGTVSEGIAIDNGVKQGDILAPTLFSIYFATTLAFAFRNCETGVLFRFRTTGKLFNLTRFRARSKTFHSLVRELLYADDVDFVAHTAEDMQGIMDRFSRTCTAFGLTISLEKTKVMFTPAPNSRYEEPVICVNGTKLGTVDDFVYLGSTISSDGILDKEILGRINKASKAFGNLEKRVWADRALTFKTKIKVYEICVLPVLLYASETWTTYRCHIKALERFHQTCLRRIFNVTKQALLSNEEVLKKASTFSIEARLSKPDSMGGSRSENGGL